MAGNRYQINLGATGSSVTGDPWFVGDYPYLTVSIESGSAAASRYTIMGSNLDGFQSSLSKGGGYGNNTVPVNGWSHVTVITNQGLYTIDGGFRWVNAVRPTLASGGTASCVTVIFAGLE